MNYLLRDVNDKTWTKFKRACGDLSMRDVLVTLIVAFANGDITIGATQVRQVTFTTYPPRSE